MLVFVFFMREKLPGAKGIATRSDRTLLGAPGLTTRNKTTRSKGHRYWEQAQGSPKTPRPPPSRQGHRPLVQAKALGALLWPLTA